MKKALMILIVLLCSSVAMAGSHDTDTVDHDTVASTSPERLPEVAADDSTGDTVANEGVACFEPTFELEASGPACSALCEEPPYGGCCTQASQCKAFCSGQGVPRCTYFGCCICL